MRMVIHAVFRSVFCALALILAAQMNAVWAGQVTVGVATNFLVPARDVAGAFMKASGHKVVLVGGSSGKLAAQVLAGAPFDVVLSGDAQRIDLLIDEEAVSAESRVTYAIGRLVLWAPEELPLKGDGLSTLDIGRKGRLAVANARLAPYGLAAQQALKTAKVFEKVQDRLVYGENIGQTFAIVATGNVKAGLVALSQIKSLEQDKRGKMILVPDSMHAPIRQDGALTRRGQNNEVARAFLSFLKTDAAKAIILKFGYSSGD